MNNEKISVIIPIYNVEKYLSKCVDSVINQTYKNIEILLIDDGSTDNSGKICNQYLNIDKRCRVYHENNCGVAHARNVGIENSSGKYLIFIDADDYIRKDMLEVLYKNITNYDADISSCNVVVINEKGQITKEPIFTNKISVLDNKKYKENLYNLDFFAGSIWNKLIKRAVINQVRFDEKLHIFEDFDFLCQLSQYVKIFVHDGNEYYYYYLTRKGSAVNSKYNEKRLTEYNARKKDLKYVNLFKTEFRDKYYFEYILVLMDKYYYLKKNNRLTDKDKENIITEKKEMLQLLKNSRYLNNYEKLKLFLKTRFTSVYCRLMYIKHNIR